MSLKSNTRKAKSGYVKILRPDKGVLKKWKEYNFRATAIYLLYFKGQNTQKADGQILLNSITKLETESTKDASYPLQVFFKGKPEHGANSPWVLDLNSNEERIDWMETLMKGSSEYLQRLAKSASVLRSKQYDPYSMAEPDVGNELTSPPQQPLNYMEPTPSGGGWHSVPTQSIETQSLPAGVTRLVAMEPQSQMFRSQNGQKQAIGTQSDCIGENHQVSQGLSQPPPNRSHPHTNTSRHSTNRSTFAHSEREHKTLPVSRANTDHHLYEMDAASQQSNLQGSSRPKAKPREPPPRINVSESMPLSASADSSFFSSGGEEPRYSSRPKNRSYSATKEPEYDLQSHPIPKERTKPMSASPAQMSPKTSKPKITPRKNVSQKPQKQADYMELLQDQDEHKYELLEDPMNSDSLNCQPELVPGFNQEIVGNFTSKQLDMLIGMLQQVQGGGKQQVTTTTASTSVSTSQQDTSKNLSNTLDHRVKFERVVSYTPQLQTNKILVTDEDDGQSYEERPDWAKAVSLSKHSNANSHADADLLTDLQEEALCIARSGVKDFVEIGEGQFGKVFRAVMQRGSESISVAVKTAKKSSSIKEKEEFHREMKIMSQMVHPNIVQLYGIIKDDVPAPWIVLEYLQNGDIKHFLMKNKRPIEKLVKYMIDVSMGMHYLSERGLVHRDLAARNVLVGETETCKVSDFGLLRELPKDDSIYHMQTNVPCPVRWMPPESISDRKFSPASDVWSFGILLWEMFYPDKTPYEKHGNLEVAMKVMKGYRLDIPPNCPPVISRIMKACWHQIPDKRPSFLLISTLLTTKVTFSSDTEI